MVNKKYIIMLIILIAMPMAKASLNTDLAHILDFAETSNHLLDKKADFNSTSETIISRTATGVNGNAWNFSSSVLQMSTNGLVLGANPRCYVIWVKPSALSLNPDVQTMFYIEGSEGLRWRVPTSAIATAYIGGTSITPTRYASYGNWNMIALSYDGSYVTIWLNKTLDKNQSVTVNTGGGSMAAYMGDLGITPDQPFDGLMDEFYSWNRSCGQTDINELYNEGAGSFYPFSSSVIAVTPQSQWNNVNVLKFNLTINGTKYEVSCL